ncbi:MAG: S9 family peptidase [Pseudomonadota bacterium]
MRRLFLFLILPTAVLAAEADPTAFTGLDVFELEVAADPQVAPDGSRIAYTRRSMNVMVDRPVSQIWIIDVDGDRHRPLVTGPASYSSPRWSPSGDRLAYVSNVEGRGPQIHVRWMDTGQTAVVTNVRSAPGSVTWSPDGRQLAFSRFVEADGKPLASPPKKPEGAKWAPPVKVIDRMPYRFDGAGYLDPGFNQVFVVSAEGGTPRQLTQGNYNHGGRLAWTSDGARLILAANRQPDANHDPVESELWSVDVASGEMTALTDRNGPDTAPTISPGGDTVAYLGFNDRRLGYQSPDVYLLDLGDRTSRNLTETFDRQIDDVQWAGRNRLMIQYDDRGQTHLATLTLDGTITEVTNDVGGVALGRPYTSGGFMVNRGGVFAYTAGRPDRPADLAAGRRGKVQRLTDLNEDALGHKQLAAIEEVTWPSKDGKYEVQGWIAKPAGFDPERRYPMILEIHGGPFAAYGPQFSPEVQLFATAGYLVFYANPRGSTSYGDAFANEIHHNYPNEDYDDLMAGVDTLIERGLVDPDRLFVTGGSGGGVLTSWIVGKTQRFRAAVVAKPVINWISFTLTADGTHFFTRYWFEKFPWDDPMAYWKRSPLSLVGNVTTPTALLTGEADYRTPISESEQYYQALKLRKVDTALIRIPEASHGIAARPSHLIAKIDNIVAWFGRYDEQPEAAGEDG